MLSVDAIEALADDLTPAMRHVLLRCSDAGWGDYYAPRCWWDVVAHRPNTSFHHTVKALERRKLVEITEARGQGVCGMMVRLTREGGRVQAALRLRQMDVEAVTR